MADKSNPEDWNPAKAAKPAPTPPPKGAASAADGGAQQVQDTVDDETEQGFRGTKVDPRPNEDYTVAGSNRRKGENLGQAGEPAPIEPAATAEETPEGKGA